ncbi:glycosyltransferase family 2 protein [Oceanobacillus piezotolerans]|uniref:Glycosyltransferase family 2 protein n=1 Tax=Oceanobacillus piezotolerans TaxID=2448030 RepID=A0A498DFH3_9BACI|nr:glycosyltransferase family A protein [Oceanobacillus piezotolerans]RLL42758.1 glycosyltransferase family 2 protein [Oceanobacillus piezotolerans]
MNPPLTVFTPTYNRAHLLPQLYRSLVNQKCKDFIWLVIDDGSTDNTNNLVKEWINEDRITIQYFFQENQGMHGAHNTAYKRIETELNTCIDSDDYLAEDAIEKIITFWKEHGNQNYAGIVGLDATYDGKVIGTELPREIKASTLTGLYAKHHVKGDKKLVYRTELTNKVPAYPLYADEKYCPLSFKYVLIDQECPLLILNQVLCHVEYQEDGSSLNMINQYRRNPKGFSAFRKVAMKFSPTYKDRFREAIHYVSSNLMLKNYRYINDSPCKLTTLLATPFGVLLNLYINHTNNKTVMKRNKVA